MTQSFSKIVFWNDFQPKNETQRAVTIEPRQTQLFRIFWRTLFLYKTRAKASAIHTYTHWEKSATYSLVRNSGSTTKRKQNTNRLMINWKKWWYKHTLRTDATMRHLYIHRHTHIHANIILYLSQFGDFSRFETRDTYRWGDRAAPVKPIQYQNTTRCN